MLPPVKHPKAIKQPNRKRQQPSSKLMKKSLPGASGDGRASHLMTSLVGGDSGMSGSVSSGNFIGARLLQEVVSEENTADIDGPQTG